MDVNWQNVALAMAGVIGGGTAVVHGILVQRLMVRPFKGFLDADRWMIARLMPLLLHFSTIAWFLGGLALVAAAIWLGEDAKLAIGLFVGSLYMFGAVGNFWAARGRHLGWVPMAFALVLIALGVVRPGG